MPFAPVRGGPRLLIVALLVVAVVSGGIAMRAVFAPPPLPQAHGLMISRPVPDFALLDPQGKRTSLADFKGRVVVLAPFMTLCHEMCPLTTGNYLELQADLEKDGLGDQVALVEVTIDPGRDTPDRLAAYATLTGVRSALLTGDEATIAAFWKFFGIAYEKTAEASPAALDWYTQQPETYDVAHQDGLFLLDADGSERIALVASPAYQGSLAPELAALLNAQGRQNLANPELPLSWTVRQALDDVSVVLGRPVGGG